MRRRLLVAVLVLGAASAAVFAVCASERLPDEPRAVVWDREACAHCHMLVGEPAFAAQAIDADGRVFVFDDPGCLLAWRAARAAAGAPPLARAWVHHVDEDHWLPLAQAAFRTVARSPMGFALGAVDAGTPGALDPAAATARGAAHVPAPEPTP